MFAGIIVQLILHKIPHLNLHTFNLFVIKFFHNQFGNEVSSYQRLFIFIDFILA